MLANESKGLARVEAEGNAEGRAEGDSDSRARDQEEGTARVGAEEAAAEGSGEGGGQQGSLWARRSGQRPLRIVHGGEREGRIGFTGGTGDFGSRFGWYVDGVRRKVSDNWMKYEVDPRVDTARRVYIYFEIDRSGSADEHSRGAVQRSSIAGSIGNASVAEDRYVWTAAAGVRGTVCRRGVLV